jgi:hypothetical protein
MNGENNYRVPITLKRKKILSSHTINKFNIITKFIIVFSNKKVTTEPDWDQKASATFNRKKSSKSIKSLFFTLYIWEIAKA